MSNNQNDGNDFESGSELALQAALVSPADLEMCASLEMYPASMPADLLPGFGIIQEEKPTGDITLHQVNAGPDEDEKVFHDMDQLKIEQKFTDFPFEDNWPMEVDQKQEPFDYDLQQNVVPVNHAEFTYQTDYPTPAETPNLLLLDVDMASYPPSPNSTIYSYDELINNNENDRRANRSRKMSVRDGKCIKIDKPYRTRRTKADMESMSKEQKAELKQEQNRINAKKCVARKNEEKAGFKELVPQYEVELERLKQQNASQKKNLLTAYDRVIYPAYDNNSPYGLPDNFQHETLKNASDAPKIDGLENLDVLLSEKEAAEQEYKNLLGSNPKNIKPNTFASQKSRAKAKFELADGKYRSTELRMYIVMEKVVWNQLAAVAEVLNPDLHELRHGELPQNRVSVDLQQFEPS